MDDTESTTTSVDDNTGNLCDNPTRDTLAEGLLGLLKPTVDQLDDRVRATRISQLELKQQIESLSEELQKVREALNNHPDLDPYVKKLIACKHKVTVVLNVLQASQSYPQSCTRCLSQNFSTKPQSHEFRTLIKKYINSLGYYNFTVIRDDQDRLNDIRQMISKEKGIRKITLPEPEPEQSTSGISSEKGSIN